MDSFSIVIMLFSFFFAAIAFWLFLNKEGYGKWFYLGHSAGFAFLAMGVYPTTTWMASLGVLIIVVAAGVQVFSDALIEKLAQTGIHIVKRRSL